MLDGYISARSEARSRRPGPCSARPRWLWAWPRSCSSQGKAAPWRLTAPAHWDLPVAYRSPDERQRKRARHPNHSSWGPRHERGQIWPSIPAKLLAKSSRLREPKWEQQTNCKFMLLSSINLESLYSDWQLIQHILGIRNNIRSTFTEHLRVHSPEGMTHEFIKRTMLVWQGL